MQYSWVNLTLSQSTSLNYVNHFEVIVCNRILSCPTTVAWMIGPAIDKKQDVVHTLCCSVTFCSLLMFPNTLLLWHPQRISSVSLLYYWTSLFPLQPYLCRLFLLTERAYGRRNHPLETPIAHLFSHLVKIWCSFHFNAMRIYEYEGIILKNGAKHVFSTKISRLS